MSHNRLAMSDSFTGNYQITYNGQVITLDAQESARIEAYIQSRIPRGMSKVEQPVHTDDLTDAEVMLMHWKDVDSCQYDDVEVMRLQIIADLEKLVAMSHPVSPTSRTAEELARKMVSGVGGVIERNATTIQSALDAAREEGVRMGLEAAAVKAQFSVDYFQITSPVDKESEACLHAVTDLIDAIKALQPSDIVKGVK